MIINDKIEKLMWILTVVLLSSITIFSNDTWGRYVLMFATTAFFCLDLFLQRGKYRLYFHVFHVFMLTLISYTALSILWAIDIDDPITKLLTFIQIFICMCVLYNYYVRKNSIDDLLSVLKWTGYIISVYSLYYYGFSNVLSMMNSGIRLDNDYANVNTIGMSAAYSIIIQIDEFLRTKKFQLESLFCIPAFTMVIATQSRKALLILIISILMLLILRNYNPRKILINIIRIVVSLTVFVVMLRCLSDFEIFAGISHRMEYLAAMFTGQGQIGASAMLRQKLIELGIEQFFQSPIFGIGIGCPHVIASQYLRFDAYLHNGFVEMLAAGGIIGFCIYYGAFVYLFFKMYKMKAVDNKNKILCFVLLTTLFFREYAMVSVYDKSTYFYFIMFFIFVKIIQREKFANLLILGGQDEDKKIS